MFVSEIAINQLLLSIILSFVVMDRLLEKLWMKATTNQERLWSGDACQFFASFVSR